MTSLFLFTDPPPTYIYSLSLHDALPIFHRDVRPGIRRATALFARTGEAAFGSAAAFCAGLPRDAVCPRWQPLPGARRSLRSEEHTSELQSRRDLVCRLLLEKKKTNKRLV